MEDGAIWGTGYNVFGQLGISNNNDVNTLTQMITTHINTPINKPKYISCGYLHTIVLMEDGAIWGTGYNSDGELGTSNNTNVNTLTQMITTHINTTINKPKYIFCGRYHTIVLMEYGAIWGTGSNGFGQLGISYNNDVNTLTQMIISRIITGSGHFITDCPPV